MIFTIILLVVTAVIFWGLCQFVSGILALSFLLLATGFVLKAAKELLK